ncbi:hypothetical protein IWX50DRAFT_313907 [Phyllosticta citricarpa]
MAIVVLMPLPPFIAHRGASLSTRLQQKVHTISSTHTHTHCSVAIYRRRRFDFLPSRTNNNHPITHSFYLFCLPPVDPEITHGNEGLATKIPY